MPFGGPISPDLRYLLCARDSFGSPSKETGYRRRIHSFDGRQKHVSSLGCSEHIYGGDRRCRAWSTATRRRRRQSNRRASGQPRGLDFLRDSCRLIPALWPL